MSIDNIGTRLIKCKLKCEGIRNEPEKGVLPRCLILEKNGRPADDLAVPACIVVGINPGTSGCRERGYYKKEGMSYEALKRYFFDSKHPPAVSRYFSKLRDFAREIGLGNVILWTDLCKCENETRRKTPHTQTFRTCARNFLEEEVKLFPETPIVGVGDRSYHALCYLFPERFVVGVPHPTGSYGNFSRLFDDKGKLKKQYKRKAGIPKDRQGYPNSVRIFP